MGRRRNQPGRAIIALERLSGEIKRLAGVVGFVPNEPVVVKLIGVHLLEQNDADGDG
jgi:hypothetical protein